MGMMSGMKKALALIAVNLVVFVVVLVASELAARLFWLSKSCLAGTCDKRFLSFPPELDRAPFWINVSRYDAVLGYAPRENISVTMPDSVPAWHGATITTDAMGFRTNGGSPPPDHLPLVLAAGDSFTFGDQVEDSQTWSACLEKGRRLRSLNTGVYGYGTAQSLLRIETSLERFALEPQLIILSTLVGGDFKRDRLDFMFSLPRVAVIKNESGELEFAPPPESDAAGSRLAGRRIEAAISRRPFELLYETSWLIRWGIDRVAPDFTSPSDARFTRAHPNAADVLEIIDWTIARFAELDTKKLFLLQYAGPPFVADPPERPERSAYIIERLEEHGIPYVDTYSAIFEGGRDLGRLYSGHHTPEGNQLVCETILASPVLLELIHSSDEAPAH
jgi:hypothetical protein